jgi:hypothetical protein
MCCKGFVESAGYGYRRLDYVVDGESLFYTCVSHGGGKDLSDFLFGEMAKDCHLSNPQFFALVKC